MGHEDMSNRINHLQSCHCIAALTLLHTPPPPPPPLLPRRL